MSGLVLDGGAFVVTLCLVWLSILLFQSVSLTLSCGVPGHRIMTAALLLLTGFFLFLGIFIPLEDTPIPWIGYVNPLLYAVQAGSAIVFLWGPPHECNDGVTEATAFPEVCANRPGAVVSNEDALERLGVWAPPGVSVAVMIAFTVFFRVLAFRLLKGRMTEGAQGGPLAALMAKLRPGAAGAPASEAEGKAAAAPATSSEQARAQSSLRVPGGRAERTSARSQVSSAPGGGSEPDIEAASAATPRV